VSSTIPYMALRLSMPFCFLGPFVEKTGPEKERHPDYMPISSISREWQKYNKRPIQKKIDSSLGCNEQNEPPEMREGEDGLPGYCPLLLKVG